MFTEDENLVEFIYKVQYRVSSAQDFLFKVRTPRRPRYGLPLKVLCVNRSAPTELDAVLEGGTRESVRIETQRVLQETLDRYVAGIQITEFNLVDVNVPAQVREAYSDVIRAREDRERYIEEARIHVNSVVPEARGQAARIMQEAEGYKAATVALAEGEANRFTLLLNEYQRRRQLPVNAFTCKPWKAFSAAPTKC